jgi:hypothetical protein
LNAPFDAGLVWSLLNQRHAFRRLETQLGAASMQGPPSSFTHLDGDRSRSARTLNPNLSECVSHLRESNVALIFHRVVGGNRRKRFGLVLGHCGCGKQPEA